MQPVREGGTGGGGVLYAAVTVRPVDRPSSDLFHDDHAVKYLTHPVQRA